MTRGFVTIDSAKIQKILEEFGGIEVKVPAALSRALNRATSSAKSEAVRQVRKDYTVKAGRVNQTISVTRSSPEKLISSITSRGESIPLYDFKVSPKTINPRRKTKVSVEVRRGSRSALDSAFIARMPNGKVGVFERTGEFSIAQQGRYRGQRRENIEQKFGPAVPVMMNSDSVVSAIQKRAEEQLEDRIPHELNRILGVR